MCLCEFFFFPPGLIDNFQVYVKRGGHDFFFACLAKSFGFWPTNFISFPVVFMLPSLGMKLTDAHDIHDAPIHKYDGYVFVSYYTLSMRDPLETLEP
jgi:hypothetical protein